MKTTITDKLDQKDIFEGYSKKIREVKEEVGKVVIGQENMIDLMSCVLLSKGHILLEGVPGLAKSLAVETFAKVIGGNFNRFQFTPDKMPSDITGTMVYNQRNKKFDYYYGPIFCNIFLADEINRASPKVQSALLQAMQEREVTVETMRYDIPNPFIVLATQNPIEQIGTYPLAESQVDRFMVKFDVGYPNKEQETELIFRKNTNFEDLRARVRTVVCLEDVIKMQEFIHEEVMITQKVRDYIINICVATRPPHTYKSERPDAEIYKYVKLGASPRATESLLAVAKSFAFYQGRNFVNFDDVNKCAVNVLRHRVLVNSNAISEKVTSDMIINEIIKMIKPF